MKFSNFPFATDEEIEALVAEHTTIPKLENLARINFVKFQFHQKSPFYPGNSEKHKAHLSLFDAIVKKANAKILELKGGSPC
jgi:hypothetical protein